MATSKLYKIVNILELIMDKEFEFEGRINFRNVMEMYRRIISAGFKPLNIYGLFARNYEKGIHLGGDFHYDELYYWVSISEGNKEQSVVKQLQNAVDRFNQDIEDCQSDDLIVANSPKVRYHQEVGKWDIETIANEEIDRMNVYKQAKYIPLIGERFHKQLPFVRNRDILIDKKKGLYQVRLRVDTPKEMDTVERLFYEIVSPAARS